KAKPSPDAISSHRAVPRTNLPLPMTSFVGREREQAAVKELVGEHRLVTLTGAGGTGETRLALQVTTDLLDRFPDGVWLVELAPLGDPALVPQAIVSVLGVQPEGGRSIAETLVEVLRLKAGVLLVLDNCEHLVQACAQIVEQVLRRCDRVWLLTTSREALGIA